MDVSVTHRRSTLARVRTLRAEIENVMLNQVGPTQWVRAPLAHDAAYLVGVRATITSGVDYVLSGLEEGLNVPVPSAAVVQAQRAAGYGVALEAIVAAILDSGRLLLGFILTEGDGLLPEVIRELVDEHGVLVQRLVGAVASEFKLELGRSRRTSERRRADTVIRLLDGATTLPATFGYDLRAWHLGVIATGDGGREALRHIARTVDRQLLPVFFEEDNVEWAWFGGSSRVASSAFETALVRSAFRGVTLCCGEPCYGLSGWRLTHAQAQAAHLVSLHRSQQVTCYRDEMVLAAVLRDSTLAQSLREMFLVPLAEQGDGAATLRDTLRHYFSTGGHVSSTAAGLGVHRSTVENRLKAVEALLGLSIPNRMLELDLALRLEAVGNITEPSPNAARTLRPSGLSVVHGPDRGSAKIALASRSGTERTLRE